jgi:hypothetical protein
MEESQEKKDETNRDEEVLTPPEEGPVSPQEGDQVPEQQDQELRVKSAVQELRVKSAVSSGEIDVDDVNATEHDEEQALPAAVTDDRKQVLLREARANRIAWIRSVPVPYDTGTPTILQETHIIKELPTASKLLTHLYGSEALTLTRLHELAMEMSEDQADPALRTGEEVLEDELSSLSDPAIQTLLVDYQAFLRHLERPESATVVNHVRHSLKKLLPSDAASTLRHLVLSSMEQLRRHQQDPENWTKRSLESFLYGHARETIQTSLSSELLQDKECYRKLQQLSFITAKHLDLSCFADQTEAVHLQDAASALLSIERFHSPYEKLQRVLKSYHYVNEALKKAQDGKMPSADDVLPTLILTVLQAKPKNLISNLRMLEVFSSPEYLRGETGYAYTNLYGAVQFLLDLDLDQEQPTNLTILPQEFRQGLEASRSAMEAKLEEATKKLLDPELVNSPTPSVILVSDVREARMRGDVVNLEWARQHHRSIQELDSAVAPGEAASDEDILPIGFLRNYTYLTVRPEDIRISDLPHLLAEYRMLVHTTETLLAERAQRASLERRKRLAEAEKAIAANSLAAELGFGVPTKRS